MSAVLFSILVALFIILRLAVPAFHKRSTLSATASAACFFVAGALLASLHSAYTYDIRYKDLAALAEKTVRIQATVTDTVFDAGYSATYYIKVHSTPSYPSFKCALSCAGGIEENNIITCDATFELPGSDADYDERRSLLSNGVVLTAVGENVTVTGKGGFSLKSAAKSINTTLSNIFIRVLGDETGGFVSALFLGNRTHLLPEAKRDFTRLGISHILAISGMHLTVICSLVGVVLNPLGKRVGHFGSILTVIFYMLITGFSPSITRSGLMLLMIIAASVVRRSTDRFTSLGLSVFIICMFDPYASADIGLQLSFGAVMAILLYTQKRSSVNKRDYLSKHRNNVIIAFAISAFKAMMTTVVVVLFLLPLEWLYFGELSIISPLTSPIFSLLCTLSLWISPFILLFSPAPSFSLVISFITNKLVKFILWLSRGLSLVRGITVSLSYPFAPFFCVLIFIAVIAFCMTRRKLRIVTCAVMVSSVLAFALCSNIYVRPFNDLVSVSMIENKKSDCCFIVSDKKAMLIDMGNGYMPVILSGLREMKEHRVTELEVLMLTHIHTSHPSSVENLLQTLRVRTVLLPQEKSDNFYRILEICQKYNTDAIIYKHGDSIIFEDSVISTYSHAYLNRSVQPVIRLDISAFEEQFTYLGGAYYEALPETDLQDVQHIWFGTHGPLYKSDFSPRVSDKCVIYTSESANVFIDTYINCLEPQDIFLGE